MSCPAPIAAITTAGSKAAISPKLTFGWRGLMSAFEGKADMPFCTANVC